MTVRPKIRVLITGASGELGSALAHQFAFSGATLLLWGRDCGRLHAVAASCRAAGAETVIHSLDLTDTAAALAAIDEADATGAIDVAIFAAGLGDIQAADDRVESAEQIVQLALVNFVAPAAMAARLADHMARRGAGRLVFVGSAAAFHALPFAAGYAASKAGLSRFAAALRLSVQAYGVAVTLVSPGFIDTAAGRKTAGSRPFLLQPAYVAARIARAAERGQAHLILPWPFRLLRWVDRGLPGPLRDRLLRALRP